MIDYEHEQLLTMAAAARTVPNAPHVGTMHRWHKVGVAGIKLEVVCLGGRRTFTSREALQRFFQRVTAAKNGGPFTTSETKGQEAKRHAARKQLIEAGLLTDTAASGDNS